VVTQKWTHWLTLALALVLSLSCDGELVPRTQVMLMVDSNLSVPQQLDSLDIEVIGPNGVAKKASASLTRQGDLPLVHTQGALAPLDVRVNGLLNGKIVVSRRALTSFVSNETRVLRLVLLQSCVEVQCNQLTCTEQGCQSPNVDADNLPTHDSYEVDAGFVLAPSDGSVRPVDASLEAPRDASSPDAAVAMDAAVADANAVVMDSAITMADAATPPDASPPVVDQSDAESTFFPRDAGQCEVPEPCLLVCKALARNRPFDTCWCKAACDLASSWVDAGRTGN
jgi:hypothetical protein